MAKIPSADVLSAGISPGPYDSLNLTLDGFLSTWLKIRYSCPSSLSSVLHEHFKTA